MNVALLIGGADQPIIVRWTGVLPLVFRDDVPDVIFDNGTANKEGFVRILGENPDAVANNIIILSNRILNIEI